MGSILDCACLHCEYYQDGIQLGPGMVQGYHYFPALHIVRKKIVPVNIYKYLEIEACKLPEEENEELKRFKCLKKIPYFEKKMFGQNRCENELLSDFPHLQSKFNYCPQCGNYGLQFHFLGLFD
jgi:hypothetical protein